MPMSMRNIDLNLLVFLDVLLKERNVTRASESLGISQPAMSNGLRRLRELFSDPLLVRTSDGMKPTERAELLQPMIREVLAYSKLFRFRACLGQQNGYGCRSRDGA